MRKLLIIVLLIPLLFSCSLFYKKDINQGSILEKVNVDKLKIGMTKKQVKKLLGSPSIIDPFHNNQWNYINHSIVYSKEHINYNLELTFKKNVLFDINILGVNEFLKSTEKLKKKPTSSKK